MSFIAEILAEIFIQFFLELLVELGVHGLKTKPSPIHPALAFVVYVLLGAGFGVLSSVFLQQRFIEGQIAAYANLAITPVVVGAAFALIGSWRSKRGTELVRLDKFLYGYTFALAFAVARFWFTAAG